MEWEEVFSLAEEVAPYAVELRHELHRVPELALQEYKTTAILRRELETMDVEFQDIGMETGVVALIHGKKPGEGKCIGIRADIDALPLQDMSGAEYASCIPGHAHACGHDAHAACLLAAAKVLSEHRTSFSGVVKLIFQPGEEGLLGAKEMLRHGVLENPHVDTMIALHDQPAFPVGRVAVSPGKIMASSDTFSVRFLGKSGHASRPSEGINALLAASHTVIALNEIVSNEVRTREEAVINVCVLQAGTAQNIIPDEAVLKGTVRCLEPKVRDQCEASIRRVAGCVAEMCRCRMEIEYLRGIPALSNEQETSSLLKQAAERVLGKDRVIPLPPVLGSEDFSFFADAVGKTCYYRLGCAREHLGEQPMLHNPAFNFNDDAFPYGIAVHVAFVLEVNG